MADSRRYGPGAQLDIEQILLEAQHRWLRPAEICEILRNYNKFRIAPEPANKPPNGSLFLFDRKVLRYFRKDGHNWRKKNDGKTIKEAHERLKAGSVDVLHCYYAHGEDNASFQRRSYWLLEEELSHIVLVHYRDVKGSRTHHNSIREAEGAFPNSQHTEESVPSSDLDGSVSTKFHPYSYQVNSQTTDTTSLNSSQTWEYADAESAYNYQSSSRYNSFPELQQPGAEKEDSALSAPYYPVLSNEYQGKFQATQGMDFSSFNQVNKYEDGLGAGLTHEHQNSLTIQWENVQEHCTSTARIQSASCQPSHMAAHPTMNIIPEQQNGLLGQLSVGAFGRNQEFGSNVIDQGAWQNIPSASELNHSSSFYEGQFNSVDIFHPIDSQCLHEYNQHAQDSVDGRLAATIDGGFIKTKLESNVNMDSQANYAAVKQPLLGTLIKEGLKKLDSFDRWMSNELGDVNELHMRSSSGAYWEAVENSIGVDDSNMASQVQLDTYTLGPSLSQDQLYSIIDFSPNCAGSRSEVEVLIMGRFLKDTQRMTNFNWACMFGEVEVPAEVVSDGILRCSTPRHEAGRVPFYVTCANRLACSEVREFEFRDNNLRDLDVTGSSSDNLSEIFLHMRFGKLLSLGSAGSLDSVPVVVDDFSNFSSQVNSLLKEDDNEWDQILILSTEEISKEKVRDQLLEKRLKEKLHVWLLQKVAEGGKGPSVLDEGGQGVLHFAAALGYDWAIPPTIEAGISINFRDMNGWTALHWAAAYGRERTVGFLISQGAAPGALTDPTPKHPRGRTPADLASSNGHKGIAGFLAASSLSSHLSSLKLKESEGDADISAVESVHTVAEPTETPISVEDFQRESSLKDTLAAVCKATQAAARIHQVFRVQSFQQKQLKEFGNSELGMSDDRALSLIAFKTNKAGRHDEPVHTAATRIQNKFRSYKGRKDYLIIRQQIVKIQAHVRGHQVRKNYRKIIWSVGILDKVILRWKRKGRGLSLFKPEALPEGISMLGTSKNEDEYDFLKEGRRQTEERLEKALARVKSMVHYPEARDQYSRLLNFVSDIQENKAANDREMSKSEESIADYFDEDLIDLEALLGDDTFMST